MLGTACSVSRSGYTGEDGFEISVANDRAEALARALLDDPAVAPIGLGARDSLRLEAGLCLYGAELDATTTPVEAALEWALQKSRRPGGARAGRLSRAPKLSSSSSTSVAPRRRVGLRPEGRAPIRGGAKLFAERHRPRPIGSVTSGSFGPSVNAPVAMGYVATRIRDDRPAALCRSTRQAVSKFA